MLFPRLRALLHSPATLLRTFSSAALPCAVCGFPAPPVPCPSLACLQQLGSAPDFFTLFRMCVAGLAVTAVACLLPGALLSAPAPPHLHTHTHPPYPLPWPLRSPQQYELDVGALEQQFKRLQRVSHPDYFSAASSDSALAAAAAAASSALNVAYRTLRSPSGRARYLLRLSSGGQGAALGEEEEGGGSASSRRVAPELLAEIMEARELVEDAATPRQALAALGQRTRQAQGACARDLTAAFHSGPAGLQRARDITVALGYYDKLLEEIERRVEEREEA